MYTKYVDIEKTEPMLSLNCMISEDSSLLIDLYHTHDEIEIVYIINGRLTLSVNDQKHTLKKNDIVFINRMTPHCFFGNGDIKYLLLQFKPTMIYEKNEWIDIKYLKPFYYTQTFKFYLGNCSEVIMQKIADVILHIEEKITEKPLAYTIGVQSDLLNLLYLMHRAEIFGETISESSRQKRDLQHLAVLLDYINTHYNEVITLEQACTIAKLDYHYFSRAFKERTGQNFVEYLTFIRILNAKKMLVETDDTIRDIAKNVGIPNPSYFNRIFKKQNGITPIEYRKKNGILATDSAGSSLLFTPSDWLYSDVVNDSDHFTEQNSKSEKHKDGKQKL